jgi:Activator of Hsp90 ATPase homolog 1-like protein
MVQISDAQGGPTPHPMAAAWPLYTLSTVTLADAGGKTLLTLNWQALNATTEEERTRNGAHAGMAQGWGGTMDMLAAHLADERNPLGGHVLMATDAPQSMGFQVRNGRGG